VNRNRAGTNTEALVPKEFHLSHLFLGILNLGPVFHDAAPLIDAAPLLGRVRFRLIRVRIDYRPAPGSGTLQLGASLHPR
jgi:hypothetical protein